MSEGNPGIPLPSPFKDVLGWNKGRWRVGCLDPASLAPGPSFFGREFWQGLGLGRGPGCGFLLRCGWLFCLPGWACGVCVGKEGAGSLDCLCVCWMLPAPEWTKQLLRARCWGCRSEPRDMIPSAWIFMSEHALLQSRRGGGSIWAASPGLLAWPSLWTSCDLGLWPQ